MQHLERAAFVTETDCVEGHVGMFRPSLEALLQITVGVRVIERDVYGVAVEPFLDPASGRFRQGQVVPEKAVIRKGGACHAVVLLCQIDLLALDARHPETVPVRAGGQRGVAGVRRVEPS